MYLSLVHYLAVTHTQEASSLNLYICYSLNIRGSNLWKNIDFKENCC